MATRRRSGVVHDLDIRSANAYNQVLNLGAGMLAGNLRTRRQSKRLLADVREVVAVQGAGVKIYFLPARVSFSDPLSTRKSGSHSLR